MNRHTQIGSQVRGHNAKTTSRLAITYVFTAACALLLVVGTSSLTTASVPAGAVAQAEATTTSTVSVTVPSAVETAQVPVAQNTAASTVGINPPPEETRMSQATEAASGSTSATGAPSPTSNTSLLPSDAPGGPGGPDTGSSSTAPGSTAGSTSFPWLPVILLGAAILAGLLYLMSRRRTPDMVAAAPPTGTVAGVTPYQPSAVVPGMVVSGDRSPASEVAAAPVVAAATEAAVAPAPFVPPVALPSTLDCPNCGVSNGFNENFCHDCGQDLRPTRAALIEASTPPADLVTETTPYLETMSRVDEQLEYVLARPRVVIGTAPGNDIVIDSLFQGWQTVDPTHAELRRDSEGFVLVDLGSGSGTFVNEMRTGENLLSNGDVIRVGDVQFVFRVPA